MRRHGEREVFFMIYCVEDDSAIRDLMVYTLNVSGFEAQGFESDTDFWPAMRKQIPELILLDVMLPGEDGLTILSKLRTSPVTADIPVIMATAKDSEYDKVIGLDSGADDYLTKPFGMMEMISRIKAVLRRSGNRQPAIISCQNITMDTGRHMVTVDGKQVSLTLKEYELLKLFMENPGQVFTRDSLLASVWSVDFAGETRTVDVHIGTLRTKLEKAGDLIRTVRGVGYKMEESPEADPGRDLRASGDVEGKAAGPGQALRASEDAEGGTDDRRQALRATGFKQEAAYE